MKHALRKRLLSAAKDRWFDVTIFFRLHWPALFLIAALAAIGAYWLLYALPHVDIQSAQWTLSTEVQSLAALLGIMLVGVTILWSQAAGEESRLRELQPKYYELLRTGGDPQHKGTPAIETLRQEYLKRIKAKNLPRQVFPYEHDKYRTHKDLFVDIARLSDAVQDYFGLARIIETIENDLKGLSFAEAEITDRVLVTWYDLRADPFEFLELITDIIQPGNNTLYCEIEGGQKFVDKVWAETLLQHVETSLERVKRFKQFRTVWFRMGFGVYVLAIGLGIAAISAITNVGSWRVPFIVAVVLGFVSIAFTVLFVHQLLRSKLSPTPAIPQTC